MKNLFPKLLFAVSMAFLVGCGSNNPKAVARKWTKAIFSSDLKSANEVSTIKSHKSNAFIISMISDLPDEEIKSRSEAKLDIVKIEGNKAIVTSSNDEDDEVKLVKQDGKWLVNVEIEK